MARNRRRLALAAAVVAAAVGAGIAIGFALRSDSGGSTTHAVATHARATARTPKAQYLFAVDAHAGTLTPAGKGLFRLGLTGVHAKALYFTDRPQRLVGTVDPQLLASGIFQADSPPNAAINAIDPRVGHQKTMGVTLLSGRYANGRLSFLVEPLPQGGPATREGGLTDVVLPRSFSHTSLFIDELTYNTCHGSIDNELAAELDVNSFVKNDHDDWSSPPDRTRPIGPGSNDTTIPLMAWFGDYQSDGGLFRGCGNTVTWTASLGDGSRLVVSAILDAPWSSKSPNSATCVLSDTARFRCGAWLSESQITGSDMNVHFVVCAKDESLGYWHMNCDDLVRSATPSGYTFSWFTP